MSTSHTIVSQYMQKYERDATKPMSLLELRAKVRKLDDYTPITKSFDKRLAEQGQSHRDEWWNSHKEHWLRWLKDYNSPGYKNRKNQAITSARVVYSRLACPPMLLWLIEASGVKRAKVKSAAEAALKTDKIFTMQSSVIRNIIQWEEVEQHLRSLTLTR